MLFRSGVNITLRQTFLILKEGIIPKDFKNLKIAKELENHEKGFMAITKYKGKFDIKFILIRIFVRHNILSKSRS